MIDPTAAPPTVLLTVLAPRRLATQFILSRYQKHGLPIHLPDGLVPRA